MYEVGQLIVYGASGVCRVEGLEHPSFAPKEMKDRLYYRLKPLYEHGVLYAPTDTTIPLRPVIDRPQAEALLGAVTGLQPEPCESHSPQILGEHYKKFLQTYRCEELLRLLKTICQKNRAAAPRSMSKTDRMYQRKATEALGREFAVALDCSPEEAEEQIRQALNAAL